MLSGDVTIERMKIPTFDKFVVVPMAASQMYMQNIGTSNVRIRMEGKGQENFFTLRAQESLPVIAIRAGSKLILKSIGEDGTIEIFYWG